MGRHLGPGLRAEEAIPDKVGVEVHLSKQERNALKKLECRMCKVILSWSLSCCLFQSVSVCFSLFQSVSVCFSLFQSVSVCFSLFQSVSVCFSLFQSVSVCFSLFQSVSVCFSLFQWQKPNKQSREKTCRQGEMHEEVARHSMTAKGLELRSFFFSIRPPSLECQVLVPRSKFGRPQMRCAWLCCSLLAQKTM